MSGVETHRVQRVFSTIAFEAVERLDARYNERAHIGLAEYTEEWHVAASGTVNNSNDFPVGEIAIEFSMDFFEAPEQRRSDLTTPTFHYGSYQAAASTFVVITAAVASWARRSDGAFVGATIRVGVHHPAATAGMTFNALLHFSFSGWGAPYDAETSESEGA